MDKLNGLEGGLATQAEEWRLNLVGHLPSCAIVLGHRSWVVLDWMRLPTWVNHPPQDHVALVVDFSFLSFFFPVDKSIRLATKILRAACRTAWTCCFT